MSRRYTITRKKWKCPHCQTVVKRRQESELNCLLYLCFLPIVLIVLLFKVIYDYSTRNSKPHTKSGVKVVVCKKCGKYLITSEDYFTTSTRAVYSTQDMLNIIEPVLEIIRETNIKFEIVKTDENVVEDIKIKYTNINNGKTLLTEIYISYIYIIVLCDGKEFKYSQENYANLIKDYAILIIGKLGGSL